MIIAGYTNHLHAYRVNTTQLHMWSNFLKKFFLPPTPSNMQKKDKTQKMNSEEYHSS